MKNIDNLVAQGLNEEHEREEAQVNRNRRDLEPLNIMDRVWYHRPPDSGDKLDSRWLGPGLIRAREGERSYVVEIKPGVEIKAHRSALKLYVSDPVGEHVPLFFHKRTVQDPEAAPDEWIVEKILRHKDVDGKTMFLTKWQGWEGTTWEPVNHFFHRYSSDFVSYCQHQNLWTDLLRQISPNPEDE